MSDERVGKLSVELDASPNKLGAELGKANKDIHQFGRKARADLADLDKGFLERLGIAAKQRRRDETREGANALRRQLGGGDVSQLLGLGVKGVIIDVIGKAFNAAMKEFITVQSTSGSLVEAFGGAIEKAPILGDFIMGFQNMIDVMDGTTAAAAELNKQLRQQEEVTRAIGTYMTGHEKLAALTGEKGPIEAERLKAVGEIQKQISALMPDTHPPESPENKKYHDAVRQAMGWQKANKMDSLLMGSEMDKGMTWPIHRWGMEMFHEGEALLQAERAPQIGLLKDAESDANLMAKILTARARRDITSSGVGALSSLLGGFEDLPGGKTWQSEREQKLLKAYTQSFALSAPFRAMLENGNASEFQKAAARSGLETVGHLRDLTTGDKMLNLRPYEPLRLPSAELISGAYTGAAEMAKERDRSDYAQKNDLPAIAKETNEILKSIDKNLTQMLNKLSPSDLNGAPMFPPGEN